MSLVHALDIDREITGAAALPVCASRPTVFADARELARIAAEDLARNLQAHGRATVAASATEGGLLPDITDVPAVTPENAHYTALRDAA